MNDPYRFPIGPSARMDSTMRNVSPAKLEEMDQTLAAQSACPLLCNKAKLPRETGDGQTHDRPYPIRQ